MKKALKKPGLNCFNNNRASTPSDVLSGGNVFQIEPRNNLPINQESPFGIGLRNQLPNLPNRNSKPAPKAAFINVNKTEHNFIGTKEIIINSPSKNMNLPQPYMEKSAEYQSKPLNNNALSCDIYPAQKNVNPPPINLKNQMIPHSPSEPKCPNPPPLNPNKQMNPQNLSQSVNLIPSPPKLNQTMHAHIPPPLKPKISNNNNVPVNRLSSEFFQDHQSPLETNYAKNPSKMGNNENFSDFQLNPPLTDFIPPPIAIGKREESFNYNLTPPNFITSPPQIIAGKREESSDYNFSPPPIIVGKKEASSENNFIPPLIQTPPPIIVGKREGSSEYNIIPPLMQTPPPIIVGKRDGSSENNFIPPLIQNPPPIIVGKKEGSSEYNFIPPLIQTPPPITVGNASSESPFIPPPPVYQEPIQICPIPPPLDPTRNLLKNSPIKTNFVPPPIPKIVPERPKTIVEALALEICEYCKKEKPDFIAPCKHFYHLDCLQCICENGQQCIRCSVSLEVFVFKTHDQNACWNCLHRFNLVECKKCSKKYCFVCISQKKNIGCCEQIDFFYKSTKFKCPGCDVLKVFDQLVKFPNTQHAYLCGKCWNFGFAIGKCLLGCNLHSDMVDMVQCEVCQDNKIKYYGEYVCNNGCSTCETCQSEIIIMTNKKNCGSCDYLMKKIEF